MSTAADVLDLLSRRAWKLGVAESLTGGAVCAQLVSVPGASATLLGGIVAYATPLKHALLGVDAALLAEHGPVHPEVAAQMAIGVRAAVAIDDGIAEVGIATTGIAGPDSPDGQPVGTVFIAVSSPLGVTVQDFVFRGDRAVVRASTVDAVLALLLDVLRE